ncbi:glycoside hydrolase family 6 protein [Streptomyces sp. S3(2020)]|uniref:glycoside hydrolase family 6 protein n=1 Tax=Streptomyces sp. S3(2020) TaxID=2732044 RepID=UPI0014891C99|nr:glycoside hydrolase family 6 protein [Streptomyces sp. S3(2020)]NNN35554.1 glycoside hydrolase family 6 protein [Streptomyces sp. S3(2020)]
MGRSLSWAPRSRASHGSGPAATARTLLAALLATLLVGLCCTGASGDVPEPFWTDPDSPAARQATEWRLQGRAEDAALMDRIAARPQAEWLHGPDPGPVVRARTTAAAQAGSIAVLVAYYIPDRDCGQYSSGGAPSAAAYRAWVDEFAAALGDRGAYVIVEPDAVAQVVSGCTRVEAQDRHALLAYAVDRLERHPHTRVYLDAGNSGWIPEPWRLVTSLQASGIARADGFALNVSNFQTDPASSTYGDALSQYLGGKHYVIDTSRNGNGPYTGTPDSWCNPPGRALGEPPTTDTGNPLLDAYLWIKRPGESDGACRGGPPAGGWWPSYALELARNAAG